MMIKTALCAALALALAAQTAAATEWNWTSVSAGGSHTMAIGTDGALWAWGNNEHGRLGDGTATTSWPWADNNRSSPVRIGTGTNWASVSAGGSHTAAIDADGALWAWGNNGQGQLGDGTADERSSPTRIGTDANWAMVSAGGGQGTDHTVAVRTDGTLWAWGNNSHGQLGDGTTTMSTSPVQIGSDSTWVYASAGWQHTLAIRSDGTLWAWGNNADWRLGAVWDGEITYTPVPVQVGADSNWTSVSAGGRHTAGIRADGSLWAWGFNQSGQLGDGTTVGRFTPVRIGTHNDWVSVSAGDVHTVGMRRGGSAWAWGNNGRGSLGDGTTTHRNAPTQTGTPTSWTAATVSAGVAHTAVVGINGLLMAWGSAEHGQLGNGASGWGTGHHTPVQVRQ